LSRDGKLIHYSQVDLTIIEQTEQKD